LYHAKTRTAKSKKSNESNFYICFVDNTILILLALDRNVPIKHRKQIDKKLRFVKNGKMVIACDLNKERLNSFEISYMKIR